MGDAFESLDDYILSMMHELIFGQLGLNGDAKERMLRAWYDNHRDSVHNECRDAIKSLS